MGQEISLCGGANDRPLVNDNDLPKKPPQNPNLSIKDDYNNTSLEMNGPVLIADEMMIYCQLGVHLQTVVKLKQKIYNLNFETSNICSLQSINSSARDSDSIKNKYLSLAEKLIGSLKILEIDIRNCIDLMKSFSNQHQSTERTHALADIKSKLTIYEECIDTIQEDVFIIKKAYADEMLQIDGVDVDNFMNSGTTLANDL